MFPQYLDWINVMTYDYHGQWDKQTGHVAPMYQHEEDENIFFNTVSYAGSSETKKSFVLFRISQCTTGYRVV